MRLMASAVCAIESTRSLRWVVRKVWRVSSSSNWSMAIMLTGPRRSILARSSAMASSALSACCSAADDGRVGRVRVLGLRSGIVARGLVQRLVQIGRGDGPGVGCRFAGGFESGDFCEHVVEGDLQAVHAGLRQVGKVAVCRGPRDVEIGDRGAQRVVRVAGRANAGLDLVGAGAKRSHPVVRVPHGQPERIERVDVGVELLLPLDDREAQLLDAPQGRVPFGRQRHGPDLELRERVLEPPDFGRQRNRAFHQRRVRCTGLGRAAAQVHRPTREPRTGAAGRRSVDRPPPAVRHRADRWTCGPPAAAGRDRRARPPPVGARARSARPSASGAPLPRPRAGGRLRGPRWSSPGGGARRKRVDRAGRFGNGPVEGSRLLRERRERRTLAVQPKPQVLDLALGLQDAARLSRAAAAHQSGSAEELAAHGRDRQARQAARRGGAFVRAGDPGLGERPADRAGIRARRRARPTTATRRLLARTPASPAGVSPSTPGSAIEKPAASGLRLAHELEASHGVFLPVHHDVLQQVAEARLDRPFVAVRPLRGSRRRRPAGSLCRSPGPAPLARRRRSLRGQPRAPRAT